jgi:peroxygenase
LSPLLRYGCIRAAVPVILALNPVVASAAFRALGFGFGVSTVSAAFINTALGSKCRPENATSSNMDIYIENIQKGKHGSDTGSYDTEGRFVPEKFEEIFAKHAKTVPDALTSDEVDQLVQANRQPGDYAGW